MVKSEKIIVMKKKLGIVLIFMLWLSVVPLTSAGQIPDEVYAGLKAGNASLVASYFNENIELVIIDKEEVCSKAQGEQILNDFFVRYKPLDFKITHQGSDDSSYAIGKLQTTNGNFRVYYLLRAKDGKSQIVQLKIDKD